MPETASPAGGGLATGGIPSPKPTSEPPMGVSSATQPTPNKGFEAAAAQLVSVALNMLLKAQASVGVTSDMGKAIHEAIGKLAKAVPPGETSPAAERNVLDKAQLQNAQNQKTMQMMRPAAQQQAAGAGGPPSGGAGGAGMSMGAGM